MSKFRVGDKVKRVVDLDMGFTSKDSIYMVKTISPNSGWLGLSNSEGEYQECWNPDKFIIAEDTSKHHVHHDLIIAWAKGAEIECLQDNGIWEEVSPNWKIDCKFRIKPEPCSEKEELTSIIADMKEQLAVATKRLEELE